MAFWVFMFVVDVLVPVTMIVFGLYFIKHAPKEINGIFGYRTTMSMKNRETWEFSHHYFGRRWRLFGWILLVISIIVTLLVFGKSKNQIGMVSMVLFWIQMLFLIIPIFSTERELKHRFDKQGNRR